MAKLTRYVVLAGRRISRVALPQGLNTMEGLCLPGLRELYLHQNKIVKIDGLQG